MFESLTAFKDSEEELKDLFIALEVSREKPRAERVRKKAYKIKTCSGETVVDSWKFNEFSYSDKDIELPIRARGLFTQDQKIVARGYDKFFNVNEVASTKLEHLRELHGPFEVTTKENGCIVFISGLEDGSLVICSKHVTGEPVVDTKTENFVKHSERAKKAVYEQLENLGKSPTEMGKILYELNATAVAELCDDEFEEHVIEYPKELAGLYLHGINANTRKFVTYPMEGVYAFADEFGFKKVHVERFNTFDSLWDFLEKGSETGTFQGREIEGFVIRGKDSLDSDFFFKYKFEEPYALYRTFRESTKQLILKKKAKMELILKQPKHRVILQAYLDFVDDLFKKEPELAEAYLQDKGIIKVRNLFLENVGLEQNRGIGLVELEKTEKLTEQFQKFFREVEFRTIICPIAVIGSGKTTAFQTLSNLFPKWLHVQNDNCANFKQFKTQCVSSLVDLPVLLLDRNNSLKKERRELIEGIHEERISYLVPNIGLRFIGVNFAAAKGKEGFDELVEGRITSRGDNHQCIDAASHPERSLRIALTMAGRLEQPAVNPLGDQDEVENGSHAVENGDQGTGITPLIQGSDLQSPDDAFDVMINVDITSSSSLDVAKRIWEVMSEYNDFKDTATPSEEQWQKAYKDALEYKPTTKKTISNRLLGQKRPEYFGIGIKDRKSLVELLESKLSQTETWKSLVSSSRIQGEFHVTIGHKDTIHEFTETKEKWEILVRRFAMQQVRKASEDKKDVPVEHYFDVRLVRAVVFDDKLITVEVKIEESYSKDQDGEIVIQKPELDPLNQHLHITIGTVSSETKAMELNAFLKQLHLSYGDDIGEGTYELKKNTARVFPLDQVLEKQQAYIMFSFNS